MLILSVDVINGSRPGHNLIDFLPDLDRQGTISHYSTTGLKDRTIRVNDEIIILQIELNGIGQDSVSLYNKCVETIEKLTMSVSYTDIYNSDFPAKLQPLEWLGR